MNRSREQDVMDELDEIIRADSPEMEKLRDAFGRITALVIEHAQHEVEFAKAMQDQGAVIKTQIKMETIKTARNIFHMCYTRIIGRRAWDEQNSL